MRDYFFVMRMDTDELAAFDALAQANQTSRPGLIRRLLNLPCAPPRGRPSKRARKTRQMDTIIPTTERLAQALEAANDPSLADMIARARAGYYDDFKSDIALPIITLVRDLTAAGHPELADRARDGEFDSTPQEAEAWFKSEGIHLLRNWDRSAGRKTAMD